MATGGGRSSLVPRVASALVLAPVALVAVWLGPPYLMLLVGLAGAVMGWEWARLCGRDAIGLGGAVGIAGIVAGAAAAALDAPRIGLSLVLLAGLPFAWLERDRSVTAALAGAGVAWIGLPCVALIWLAQDAGAGRATVLWILAVVWATDIGAYVIGKAVGGPRLAPRLSPNKTWAGLVGGIACATATGIAAALAIGAPLLSPLVWLSAVLAVVEQAGDLAESATKRHFGVKDSSSLIPGHGGLLDRLDGMLAVVPVVALLSLVGGSSVVTWR